MAKYTDGFLIPIPQNKLEAYRKMAADASAIWMEYGALDYKECVLEDANSEHTLPFNKGIQLEEGETVVFSWILFESRQHRDEVNAKVMADPRLQDMCNPNDMPFDPKRMLYSGFQVIVDGQSK